MTLMSKDIQGNSKSRKWIFRDKVEIMNTFLRKQKKRYYCSGLIIVLLEAMYVLGTLCKNKRASDEAKTHIMIVVGQRSATRFNKKPRLASDAGRSPARDLRYFSSSLRREQPIILTY